MTLPHFDITSFAGQIIWLFLAAGITYLFNKIMFIPLIASSIDKRHTILKQYVDETEQIDQRLENLRSEMDLLLKKTQIESRAIIESAMSQSQEMFLQHLKRNNDSLTEKIQEYDKYIVDQNIKLSKNFDLVIKEVKDAIVYFIARQNIF